MDNTIIEQLLSNENCISLNKTNIRILGIPKAFYYSIYTQLGTIKHTEDYLCDGIFSRHQCLTIRNDLINRGLVEEDNLDMNPEKAKQLTIAKANTGFTCEWCGNKSYILHNHHYPIPKSKGGTNLVKICPNCHYTYHSIYKGE